jgi:hypothetical protein
MAIVERKDIDASGLFEAWSAGGNRFLFAGTDEADDPACRGLEDLTRSQIEAFRAYLLPRLESARDEVSEFVLREMKVTWDGDLGNAVSDAIEHFPDKKLKRLRAWIDEALGSHVYPYVKINGDEVEWGLMLTDGGPEDKIIEYEPVAQTSLPEDFIKFWRFKDALHDIVQTYPHHARMWLISPFVSVHSEKDYDEAVSEMSLEGSAWKRPGLYDFRAEPPVFYKTLDDYIHELARNKAEELLSRFYRYLVDPSDVEDVCKTLRGRAS